MALIMTPWNLPHGQWGGGGGGKALTPDNDTLKFDPWSMVQKFDHGHYTLESAPWSIVKMGRFCAQISWSNGQKNHGRLIPPPPN